MLRPFWFANSQALDDPQGDSNKNEKRNTPVYLSIFIKKGFFSKGSELCDVYHVMKIKPIVHFSIVWFDIKN